MNKIAVNILNVEKDFKLKDGHFKAVNHVSMQVNQGDI